MHSSGAFAAMMGQGIRVKVDLIVGLPGDTVESVRKGLLYLLDNGLCSDLQAFNLAVLPGTAFRRAAAELFSSSPNASPPRRPEDADTVAAPACSRLVQGPGTGSVSSSTPSRSAV